MLRRLFTGLLFIPLVLSFSGDHPRPVSGALLNLVRQANAFFELNTPAGNNQADRLFNDILKKLPAEKPGRFRDSLQFDVLVKHGILLDIATDYSAARSAYCEAIDLHSKGLPVADSTLCQLFVYTGTVYYNLNQYDSADYFLQQANNRQHIDPSSEINLFNTLGALHYDNGNFMLSKNYFTRALQIVHSQSPPDTPLEVGLSLNIASSLLRLEKYQEALTLFQNILPYHQYPDYVYLSMGHAQVSLGNFEAGLNSFRRVNRKAIPGVLNEMANAALGMGRLDSAGYFLDEWKKENTLRHLNKLDLGINELYRARVAENKGDMNAALQSLQQAVCSYSGDFQEKDIRKNPSSFTGTFAHFGLFDALTQKARIFVKRYETDHHAEDLQLAHDTYTTALSLLSYIEKSYETDDAKIFLKEKSWPVYVEAMELSLRMDQLQPGKGFLEEAFVISQRNKASVLRASLRDRYLVARNSEEEKLLSRERNIKYNLARLNIRSSQVQDSTALENLDREKSMVAIELADLQKTIERNRSYYRAKYEDSLPSVQELQNHLQKDQALISYQFGKNQLHVFVLTSDQFLHRTIDSLPAIRDEVTQWLALLTQPGEGRRFQSSGLDEKLYHRLMAPVHELVRQKKDWTIIPDGILYSLPFESLRADGDDMPLLAEAAIHYAFSAALMLAPSSPPAAKRDIRLLAMAPFVHQGWNFIQLGGHALDALPASQQETGSLQGRVLTDSLATRSQFLQLANKYSIVHLATHAYADARDPGSSFIAFFPAHHNLTEDGLFLEELYGLNLDSVKLMILSACETGNGTLVNNEGLMSLARAFTYAGCSSVVNSLWKADDEATATIMRNFHRHLEEGMSKAKALQKAKLEFLQSDPMHPAPAYWSHLILIGNTAPLYAKPDRINAWMIGLASGVLLIGLLFFLKKKKKSRRVSRTMDFKVENVV